MDGWMGFGVLVLILILKGFEGRGFGLGDVVCGEWDF